MQYLLLCE